MLSRSFFDLGTAFGESGEDFILGLKKELIKNLKNKNKQ